MMRKGQTSWIWAIVMAIMSLGVVSGMFIIIKDIQENNLHANAIRGGADETKVTMFETILATGVPIALALSFAAYVIITATRSRGY